jgi:hypothetical protein
MSDTLDTLTVAAATESQKLQRHFGRFDILFFLICTIVGVDTIATVAQGGGQAFTWMMIFAVVFFVPQALLFSELGAAFPQEGGPYLWTRLAFGHLAGAVNNFLYWITNPVWIGGSLTISCIGAVEVFFNYGRNLPTPVWYIVALAFVWVSIVAAIMSFSVGKWLPTAGAFARFILLGVFTISVIIYAVKHGAHGLGASGYKPSESGFVLLVGVLLFNYVGFELPSSAGQEMINPQRDVPFAIARSAVGSVVLYALPVIGILIVLPSAAITNFSGFISAIQTVFTVYGGHVTAAGTATLSGAGLVLGDASAILFIVCLLTSGATWIMGSDRALAVSCYDGAGPRVLGHQRAVRHPGPRQRLQRDRGHDRRRPGSADHQRRRREVLQRGARRDDLDHADQLPAHLPGAVEAAAQPSGYAPPIPDACLPDPDGHPDGPGVRGRRPAHCPGAGQLMVRQRLHSRELDLRSALHLPVDRAHPGAGLHVRRGAVLVAGPADQGPARRGAPGRDHRIMTTES